MNTPNSDSSLDPKFLKFYTRVLVILTSLGVAALLLAIYILPRRPAVFVAGLAVLFVLIAVSHLVFFGATRISLALEGPRRTLFQVAISLAVPVVLGLYLASRADALPLETLWTIFTPWLLLPLGVLGWLCWSAAEYLDRGHPFRGFLIVSAALFVLCWLWSAGLTTDSDGDDSHSYLDPKKAKRARETGEYVWRFAIYVTTAYVVLFLRWRKDRPKNWQKTV